jgi:nucleoside-diphosphate-sugar epimerase
MNRVLVTGATGVIAYEVASRLVAARARRLHRLPLAPPPVGSAELLTAL